MDFLVSPLRLSLPGFPSVQQMAYYGPKCSGPSCHPSLLPPTSHIQSTSRSCHHHLSHASCRIQTALIPSLALQWPPAVCLFPSVVSQSPLHPAHTVLTKECKPGWGPSSACPGLHGACLTSSALSGLPTYSLTKAQDACLLRACLTWTWLFSASTVLPALLRLHPRASAPVNPSFPDLGSTHFTSLLKCLQ